MNQIRTVADVTRLTDRDLIHYLRLGGWTRHQRELLKAEAIERGIYD